MRGVAHPGVAYRPWAFSHHAYSDVRAMSGDRSLGGGRPAPYLDDRIEYPVLLGLALWAPSWLPGGQIAHFTATYLLLAACLAATLALLGRMPGASRGWLAGTPALAYYAGLNWDLLPIALLAAAAALFLRGRTGASGVAAALGIAAKLWPAALLPAAAGALWRRRDGRAALAGGVALGATLAAVNLPFAIAAPASGSWFWRFNAARSAENSVWEALGVADPRALNALGLAFLCAAAVASAGAAARARDAAGAVRLGTALVLLVWIATNKVWSPQYALYGFLAGALASAPAWLFWLETAVAAADYHLAFEVRSGRALFWFFDRTYYAEEIARTVAWGLLAAWIARELVRSSAARAPEEARAA